VDLHIKYESPSKFPKPPPYCITCMHLCMPSMALFHSVPMVAFVRNCHVMEVFARTQVEEENNP
jgi:hypothetical protein